jgi:hypothetical protein
MFMAPMPLQNIPIVMSPQEDCAWCWPILHEGQPYPSEWSSSICQAHETWILAQLATRRARQQAERARVQA